MKLAKYFFIFLVLSSFSLPQEGQIEKNSSEKVAAQKPALSSHSLSIGNKKPFALDLKQVFYASPVIYSILLIMSFSAVAIWLYTLTTFRNRGLFPKEFIFTLEQALKKQDYEQAAELCKGNRSLLSAMLSAGLSSREYGAPVMVEAMQSEGKRVSAHFWQRLTLLNDIVMIAPMLGLLGTVIGMFYSFYDVNRSVESMISLFDGLGVAVGTTVAGLIVAIMAMIFYTTLKYRLVRSLSLVENEALSLSNMITTKEI